MPDLYSNKIRIKRKSAQILEKLSIFWKTIWKEKKDDQMGRPLKIVNKKFISRNIKPLPEIPGTRI